MEPIKSSRMLTNTDGYSMCMFKIAVYEKIKTSLE